VWIRGTRVVVGEREVSGGETLAHAFTFQCQTPGRGGGKKPFRTALKKKNILVLTVEAA